MSSQYSPFPGPTAPESNPPIEPQWFKPSLFVIADISLGATTTVTTETNHNYVIGQQIKLLIPPTYGAQQINGQTGYVISIPSSDEVVVTINSLGINAFIPNPSYGPTPPQIAAIGDVNSGIISTTGTNISDPLLPGSFSNTSPISSF